MFDIESLKSKSDTELTKISKDLGIGVKKTSDINEKIYAILDFQASNPQTIKDYLGPQDKGNDAGNEEAAQPKKRGRKPAAKAEVVKTPEPAKPETLVKEVRKKAETTTKAEVPVEETAKVTEETSQPEKKQRRRVTKTPPPVEAKTTPEETAPEASEPVEVVAPAKKETQAVPQQKNNNQNNNNNNQNRQHHHNQNRNNGDAKHSEPQKKEYSFDGIVTVEGDRKSVV